ncbi:MAG: DUF58 domain-containing protein [Caldilineaceae bacterium]
MTQQPAQPPPHPVSLTRPTCASWIGWRFLYAAGDGRADQGERRSPKADNPSSLPTTAPYTEGDDFRRIDWNAYARLERFFIKLFVEEEDLLVHLLVDASAPWTGANPTSSPTPSAPPARWIHRPRRIGRITISTLGGARTTLPRGRPQALPLFRFLQDVQPNGEADLAAALTSPARRRLPAGTIAARLRSHGRRLGRRSACAGRARLRRHCAARAGPRGSRSPTQRRPQPHRQ